MRRSKKSNLHDQLCAVVDSGLSSDGEATWVTCDRRIGHSGPHSWRLESEVQRLRTDVAAERMAFLTKDSERGERLERELKENEILRRLLDHARGEQQAAERLLQAAVTLLSAICKTDRAGAVRMLDGIAGVADVLGSQTAAVVGSAEPEPDVRRSPVPTAILP